MLANAGYARVRRARVRVVAVRVLQARYAARLRRPVAVAVRARFTPVVRYVTAAACRAHVVRALVLVVALVVCQALHAHVRRRVAARALPRTVRVSTHSTHDPAPSHTPSRHGVPASCGMLAHAPSGPQSHVHSIPSSHAHGAFSTAAITGSASGTPLPPDRIAGSNVA